MARDYQTKSNVGALPDSITATRFGAGEFNSLATEIENAVTSSDQTLAPADGTGEVTDQLAMALAIYGAGGAFYHADTGAVNAYVLTPISPKESPPAYFDGFTVIFEPGTTNTTASTVNVNSLGIKDITYSDGNALTGGELSGSCGIKYNLSDDRFELLFSSGGLAGLSAYYVADASQADQGATSANPDTMTIYDIATLVGTSKNATILLKHNPVAGNQTSFVFDTSLDLSTYPNLFFKFDHGAQLTRTTGDEVLTVYSPKNLLVSERQQITSVDMLAFSLPDFVNVEWWGGSADNSTDNANPFAYAMVAAKMIKLLSGVYRSSAEIEITEDSTQIMGSGRNETTIDFYNHTDGIYINNTSSTQLIYVKIADLWLKGSAPDAGVSDTAATAGISMNETSKSLFLNLYIEDFVDGIYCDADSASSSSAGSIYNLFINCFIDQNYWPNQYNSGPRYGVRFRNSQATTNKPQIFSFNNCVIYSQITVKSDTYDGDAAETDFALNVGSGTFGLSAEDGIKVYVKNATSGLWEKQAITTDYTLWDVTGAATQINAGDDAKAGTMPNSNGYAIEDIEVRFLVAPASGTDNIAIVRIDPYGEVGYYWPIGSGNRVIGGAVGGYNYGVQLGDGSTDADDNTIEFDYAQLCNVLFKVFSGDPLSCKLTCADYSERDIDFFTDTGTATNLLIDNMAGVKNYYDSINSDVTLTGAYQDVLSFDIPNARPGTYRKINCDIDFEVEETTTTSVRLQFLLIYSDDGWVSSSTLKSRTMELAITGATGVLDYGSLNISFLHQLAVDNVYNITKTLSYKIQARMTLGDTGTINGSATSAITNGIVEVLNP